MNDEQAGHVAEAVLGLAAVVRDEGPTAVQLHCAKIMRAAGGNAHAALTVAAALIDVDKPINRWWQHPLPPRAHVDHAEYDRLRSNGVQHQTALALAADARRAHAAMAVAR